MVNEGDGVAHEGKSTCRSQQSVTLLSACFIDTDNCPRDRIDEYLHDVGIEPHLIVESSPARFHYYFLIEPTLAREENVERWQSVQHMLHRLGNEKIENPAKVLGTDATMHDYAKVLRVPGFTHVAKIHTVAVVEVNEHAPYQLDNLWKWCEGSKWESREASKNGTDYTGGSSPVSTTTLAWDPEEGTPLLGEGERYSALQTLSLALANEVKVGLISEATGRARFEHFAIHALDNEDEVYCSERQLTNKSWELWRSALRKIRGEKANEIKVLSDGLGEPAAANPSRRDPWHLPDEFYLNAPGGFGDVVRQAMGFSQYPCAALCFGTFLTGLSVLKAQKVLTPRGSSCALYTLNVAPSGFGKGDPMTLLQNMLNHNGMVSLIGNEIRSDRGMIEHLHANNGVGLFLLDEVAPLFRAIQREDANTHHANIAALLLKMFSNGAMKSISFGKVAKAQKGKNMPEIVLNNPVLGFCGYTVPQEFKNLFTSDSVAKGLFQRFIPIVPEVVDRPENLECDKHAIIKSDLFLPYYLEPQEIGEDGEPVSPIMSPAKVRCSYTPAAEKAFRSLAAEYRTKMIETNNHGDNPELAGLFSRVAEQVERVATVLAPEEEIDVDILEWCIGFIESRHKATLATAGTTLVSGRGKEGLEKETALLEALRRACEASGKAAIPKRDVYMRCRRAFRDSREFDASVAEAVEIGKISLERRKDSGKRALPQYWLTLKG
jgi:hypothetical protein